VDEYLRATAISEFFGKDTFDDVADIQTLDDALAHAISLEKATLLFYQALRDNIGGTVLDLVIEAEKRHLASLTGYSEPAVTDGGEAA
jgi:hypothetical protein